MIRKSTLILSILITLLFSILKPVVLFKEIWIPIVVFITSYVGLIIVFFLFLLVVSFTIDMKKEYEHQNKFYLFLFMITLEYINSVARVKVITKGMEKIPKDQRYLLVFNHKSRFDPMIQCQVFKQSKLVQISKPENFKIPIAGPFMKRCCFLAIDRDNNRNALKTIVKGIKYIVSQEMSVGIAPEGTRNFEDGLLPFKAGSFKIAYKAMCPLVVCTMRNTLDVHKNFPWKKTVVEIRVIDCIPYEQYKDLSTIELADKARRMIADDLGIKEENDYEVRIVQ